MKKLCKGTYIFANNDFFCDVYKEKAHWNYRIWGKKGLLEECREYFSDGFDIDLEDTFRRFINDINQLALLYRMEKKNKTRKIGQK